MPNIKLVFYFTMLLIGSNAYSFDTRTHVLIADKVYSDLSDNKLDVAGQPLSIDSLKTQKVKQNYRAFLYGSIGPDAFPDLLSGQVTVHPGVNGGWVTSDWLDHLMKNAVTDQEFAFAYGYLTHAAADSFAHTYVNLYAGDLFKFEDDMTEEARHSLVEKYIAEHQPKIESQPNKEPYQLFRENYWDVNSDLPVDFIRRTLIENREVLSQYKKGSSDSEVLKEKYFPALVLGNLLFAIKDVSDKAKEASKYDLTNPLTILNKSTEFMLELERKILQEPLTIAVKKTKRVCDKRAVVVIGVGNCILWKTVTYYVDEENPVRKGLVSTQEELNKALEEYGYLTGNIFEVLADWHKNIQRATDAFIIANAQSSTIVLEKGGRSPIAPYTTWLLCYGRAFLGIYQEQNLCDAGFTGKTFTPYDAMANKVNSYYYELNDLQKKIVALVNPFYYLGQEYPDKYLGEHLAKLHTYLSKLDIDLNGLWVLVNPHLGLVSNLYPEYDANWDDIIMGTHTSPEFFKSAFNNSGNKNLLPIPDIETRLRNDMGIKSNETWSFNKFKTAENALTLSKLFLLSTEELNSALYANGVRNYQVTDELYFRSIASIDGGYNWQDAAPPMIRAKGHPDKSISSERAYGYNGAYPGSGNTFWSNEEVKSKFVAKAFYGPVGSSLLYPPGSGSSHIDFSHTETVYCNSSIYADSEQLTKCFGFEVLIPVLMNLH